MKRRAIALLVTLALVGLARTPVEALTMVLNFDAANYSTGTGTLPDSVTPASYVLQPRNEAPANPLYANPVYHAFGAGPQSRPYIDFAGYGNMYAATGKSTPDGSILQTAGTAQGYTLEAYLRFNANYSNLNNGEIGATTFGRNSFFAKGAAYDSQAVFSTVWVNNTSSPVVTRSNINSLIVADGSWYHIVKTNDIVGGNSVTTWYLNGSLVSSVSTPVSAGTYHYYSGANVTAAQSGGSWAGGPEHYGQVGEFSRDFRGVGYRFFRVYQGAATQAEVTALYNASPVPEPASLCLLGLGGLTLLRRRK